MPGVPREIDPQALDEYLTYQYVPHPQTIFRGHRQAAARPLWRSTATAGSTCGRYWQPDFNAEDDRPAEDYARELRELLTSSVEMRLQSDVPLGAFLSGGIDSTIVVGLMQQLSRRAGADVLHRLPGAGVRRNPLRPDRRPSGSARSTRSSRCEPDAMEVLPKLVWHYDEPFADSSAVPTWYVSQLTRQHVTVALTGDGGDELFAGYPRYQAVWLAELVRPAAGWLRRMLAGRYWQRLPCQPAAEVASPAVEAVRRDARACRRRGGTWSGLPSSARPGAAELYSDELPGQRCPRPTRWSSSAAALARSYRPRPGHGVQPGRPGDLSALRPDDQGGHRLDGPRAGVPAAVSGPSGGGVGGADARAAEVPPRPGQADPARTRSATCCRRTIQRRPKMGFGVPLDHWFRGPVGRLRPGCAPGPADLGARAVPAGGGAGLVEDHVSGRFDHSYRLWSLLVLELWQRRWMD